MGAWPAGVLPGRYQVVWRLNIQRLRMTANEPLEMCATAEPVHAPRQAEQAQQQQQQQQQQQRTQEAAASVSRAMPPQAWQPLMAQAHSTGGWASVPVGGWPERTARLRRCAHGACDAPQGLAFLPCLSPAGSCGMLCLSACPVATNTTTMAAGELQVTEPSVVKVKFFAHDNWWKCGLVWDYVQLVPAAASEPSPQQPRRSTRSSGLLGGWWSRR